MACDACNGSCPTCDEEWADIRAEVASLQERLATAEREVELAATDAEAFFPHAGRMLRGFERERVAEWLSELGKDGEVLAAAVRAMPDGAPS